MANIAELRARLEELTDGPVDAPERLQVLVDLAWEQRLTGERDAEARAEEAFRLANETGQLAIRAQAARVLVMYRRWRHRLADAVEVGLRGLNDFRELGDHRGVAAVLDLLASVFDDLGDHATAFEYAREAHEVAEASGDAVRVGWALSSLGLVHESCGEQQEALAIFERARAAFASVDNWLGQSRIDMRIGKLQLAMKDISAARHTFDRMNALVSRNPVIEKASLDCLGALAKAEGNYDDAKRHFRAAIEGQRALGVRGLELDTRLALAHLHIELDEHDEAVGLLQNVLTEQTDSEASPRLAKVHELLAEACEQHGLHADALHHLKELGEQRRLIHRDEARAKIVHERSRIEIQTARKDAEIHRLRFVELAQMQAKLVESEKLAALGQLAAGVAHELNTPLGVIQSNLELQREIMKRIQARIPDDSRPATLSKSLSRMSNILDTSELAIQRASRFVRSVMQLSGVDSAPRQAIDLRETIEVVARVVGPNLPDVNITLALEPVPSITTQLARANQALMAVLMHAAEATPERGSVHIQLTAEDKHAVVRVRDEGPSLSADQLARIFEVGFDDADGRVHLALGLPTVATALNALGGGVEAENHELGGTTIILRFPLS